MLAKRTDKIIGEGLTLINITAYLADITLFTFGLRLGFDIILIVVVGHCFSV